MSIVIDIADAVVAALNEESFSVPFQANRAYRPSYELEQYEQLRVTVVPKTLVTEPANRTQVQHEVAVDIAIQKRVDDENSSIDPLMTLVEEVADFFRQRRILPDVGAVWARTENTPIYSPEHLQQYRLFTSLLTVTFRAVR